MRMRELLCAAILSSFLLVTPANSLADPAESDAGWSFRRPELEWQILTKRNFSSEIRRHPHLLLMVTLPWSGESRSLMKEVSQLVADKQEEFGFLKVRVVYRNSEKMLADILGVSEGIALFYYHHSTSYKYQGRLRAQNILASVHFMSHEIEEVPLKTLHSQDDLESFLQSTDKAVILLEFCGWSAKLLDKKKNEDNESLLSIQNRSDNAGILGENLTKEANVTLAFDTLAFDNKNKKDLKNEELTCGVENGFAGFAWLAGFTWANQSASRATENRDATTGISCTLEEFQQFESFFSKFTTIAREYYLPPERQRFGLISERSLLPFLGVDSPKTWLLMLQFSGCVNCSIVLQEGDDLRTFLQKHNPLVMELDVDGHNLEHAFPANRPSIILFVDRSSDSSKVRGESKSSLEALKKFAQHNQLSYRIIRGHDLANRRIKKDFLSPKVLKVKDKLAIMLINKGESISLENIDTNTQGNHAYDILTYLIHQNNAAFKTKETKVSLLAKEVGFQLLSDDFEVQVVDSLPSDKENDQLDEMVTDAVIDPEYLTSEFPEESTECSNNMNNGDLAADNAAGVEEFMVARKLTEKNVQIQSFLGSIFFSDGGYQLLRALTEGSIIPSVVILDPVMQQHYVFSEETNISYSSLINFVDKFLNGSLTPYQQSASPVVSSRETPRPPFVNLDFHEADSIPRVTANTFCKLVVGFKHCQTGNKLPSSNIENFSSAWKMDVLVFFSSSWCGFCQRMELVVREVHRAFKSFMSMRSQSKNMDPMHIQDKMEDTMMNRLPSVFFMDCTLNDCGSFLKPIGKKEVYPALLLFPGENKSAISYEGDVSVVDIIEFLISRGSNSQYLSRHKGFLWTQTSKGSKSRTTSYDLSPSPIEERAPHAENEQNEFHQGTAIRDDVGSRTLNNLHDDGQHVVLGSVLVATDKLLDVFPFDGSTILIVMADRNLGFQGMIINKRISWDVFKELGEELEPLKRAPLFYGGPIRSHGSPLVSLARRPVEWYTKVSDGLYFGDPVATRMAIEQIKSGGGEGSVDDYWFFLGFSSWEWTQLFNELAEGAWHLNSSADGQLDWPDD